MYTILRAAFAEAGNTIPFDELSGGGTDRAAARWLEKRMPHTLEHLVQTFHRLQPAAIRDAFGLREGEKEPQSTDASSCVGAHLRPGQACARTSDAKSSDSELNLTTERFNQNGLVNSEIFIL